MRWAADGAGGHHHDVTFAVTVGTLPLRVLLVAGVFAIAGYTLLRPFLGTPGRAGTGAVAYTAAGCGVLTLLLTAGLDLPRQAALLVLAALAVPVLAVRRNAPRWTTATRRLAPWVLVLAAAGSAAELARAWLGGGRAGGALVLLHTALALALVALSWSALCRPGHGRAGALPGLVAEVLAAATVIAVVQAETLATAAG